MRSKSPVGHQYALALLSGDTDKLETLAKQSGTQLTLEAFRRVQDEEPVPAFLHSALCAMSLPTKRPKDETAPIIREDGKYALAISPRPVLRQTNGKATMETLGVPYGSYPRVALIFLFSQAVIKQSRDVYLGRNFTDWMRRLGYQTVSYGPRGTANLMKQQVDRLLACEWQIRWNGDDRDESAFAVRDVKISNEYAGSLDKDGAFAREIRMSEVFYKHLVDHAVPLNEVAVRELKNTPTALDLYTYFAYRLPRITSSRGQTLSWDQLARHLGNAADTKRFRQTVRETMQLVSAVYPNANVDVSGRQVVLHASPAPLERKLIGRHLGLVKGSAPRSSSNPAAKTPKLKKPSQPTFAFPSGSLSYGDRQKQFHAVGVSKGAPWCVDTMADAFRKGCPEFDRPRTDEEWLRLWEAFVISYARRRAASANA